MSGRGLLPIVMALLPLAHQATAQTPPRDLFRAGPETFAPRFDRLLSPEELGVFFPIGGAVWPVWGPMYPSPYPYPLPAGMIRPPQPPVIIVVPPVQAPLPSAATQLPAAAPLPSAVKKTLYVIPGCYAGDKLPRLDQLRPGCRLADLRTISPDL